MWSMDKGEGLERPLTMWDIVVRIECKYQVNTNFPTFGGVVLVRNLFGIVIIDHVRNKMPWYIDWCMRGCEKWDFWFTYLVVVGGEMW